MESAVILCEGKLSSTAGKTARGLVRYSKKFRIIGVIDSTNAGRDAGEVVDGIHRNIPVFSSIAEVLEYCPLRPQYLIVGVATVGGMLPQEFKPIIKEALQHGISVISGLHEFLANDEEFSQIAKSSGASIIDMRKEPPLTQLHKYRNLASKINAVRIPVLGTDAAIGKRTTAIEIVEGLNRLGVKSEFVATGQTGLLQGAKYGVPLDAIQGDYMVGELENAIYQAWLNEKPDIIIVEGQGALSHPAYVCGTRAIISATKPDAIILQHAPGRKYRTYDPELKLPMPDLDREIVLYEAFSNAPVIALGINHEGLPTNMVPSICRELEARFRIPAVDVFLEGPDRLVKAILDRFPFLSK
ncbi:MAG: DUF1611 domain-containing protein [Methanomassiliicoccales archaeon]